MPRSSGDVTPPALLCRLIAACLPLDDRRQVLEDLDDLFQLRVARGATRARLWYARQTAGFVLRVLPFRTGEMFRRGGSVRSDFAVSVRSLRRRPAFAIAFTLTLAVGVGALGAVHSAARSLLLRPPPDVREPEALLVLRLGMRGAPPWVSYPVSHPDYVTLRERLPVDGALAAMTAVELDLLPPRGDAQRVKGAMVSSNFFGLLGVPLHAGRAFRPDEEGAALAYPVAVISYQLAERLAGRPADAVGLDVRLNGASVRVIGVTPRAFRGAELPGGEDIWVSLSALTTVRPGARSDATTRRGYTVWGKMIARSSGLLQPEVAAQAANSVMKAVRNEFTSNTYGVVRDYEYQAFAGVGLDPAVRSAVRSTLGLLGLAALFLLCLTVANLANLALLESQRRQVSTAVRVALGASRSAIARLAVVEALLLGGAGALITLMVVAVVARTFPVLQLSEHGAELGGLTLDARAVGVILVAAVGTALIAFARPALSRAIRSLAQLGRDGSLVRGRFRVQRTLVGVQVTFSIVLLVLAAMLARTVVNLRNINLGFSPEKILMFSVDPHLHRFDEGRLLRLAADLRQDFMRRPEVAGAAFVSPPPFSSSYVTATLAADSALDVEPVRGAGYYVSAGFLEALGVIVLAGDRRWRADSGTAVITRSMWEGVAPGSHPEIAIGRVLVARDQLVRIAAVIEDVNLSAITEVAPPTIFHPLSRRLSGMSIAAVLSTGDGHRPTDLGPVVHGVVRARSPDLPIFDVRTGREAIDLQFAERHIMARVASILSGIGIFLAAVGLYGVLATVASTRRKEMGIRMALGASPGTLLRHVIAHGLLPVLVGMAAGLGGAAMASRYIASHLYGVARFDVQTYGIAAAALLASALIASIIPAVRASRVRAADVLREE